MWKNQMDESEGRYYAGTACSDVEPSFMKRRRALLFTLSVVLALFAVCGWWVHVQQRQYRLNQQLIDALIRKDAKIALSLVNAGANPNTRCDKRVPSIQLLIEQMLHHQHAPVPNPTAFMVACGSQQNSEDGVPGGSYIEFPENVVLIRAMLAHDANVNAKTFGERTALHNAVRMGLWHTAELLLQHGADVNARDKVGDTPLMDSATDTDEDGKLKRLLLSHGANSNLQNSEGETALHHAVRAPGAKYALLELLAHGANANLRNKEGLTPLQLAHKIWREDYVRLLQQHGVK
jgi:ankyrin repeat protein